MPTNAKTKLYTQKQIPLPKILLITILLTSLFNYVSTTNVEASSLGETIHVETEEELKTAINNTPQNTPTTITLNKDINLTQTLTIPTNKNITLTSKNNNTTLYKLIGARNANTITINNGGTLTLDGITITHEHSLGTGVVVNSGGKLYMLNSKISNNSAYLDDYFAIGGGGVYNNGTFTMYSGTISTNFATDHEDGRGGGIFNNGTFSMYGGEISGNSALAYMGGNGGGVFNSGIFTMYGGTIFNNSANSGGGVYNTGIFEMLGGLIDNNTVKGKPPSHGGGGSNPGVGGGICNTGTFTMSNGTISNNKATSETSKYGCGGGMMNYGTTKLLGGKISDNTAKYIGGGICVYNEEYDKLFVGNGIVFENNRASTAYKRASTHDSTYNSHIGNNVTWSTPFTQGYNNYDISYTNGTKILIVIDNHITLILTLILGTIITTIVTAYFYSSKRQNKRLLNKKTRKQQ
jgi:hypothetical protein